MVPIPIYFQLLKQLKKLIVSGALPILTKLPRKLDLAEHLEISREAVRQAYKEFAVAGLIKRQQSKGIFVAEDKKHSSAAPYVLVIMSFSQINKNSIYNFVTGDVLRGISE